METQKITLTEEQRKEIEAQVEAALERSNQLLTSSVHSLLKSHAFLGHLIQMLVRNTTTEIPTAAVAAIHNRYHLLINPFFYSSLSIDEAKAILTHEMYHLLNDHLKRRRNFDPKLWNVAADMAINCYIQNLPRFDRETAKKNLIEKQGLSEEEAESKLPKADKDGKCASCLLPGDYGLPERRTAEFYYNQIMNNQELKKQFQQPKVYINPETGETNLSPEEQEKLKQDIKDGKVTFDFGNPDHEQWGTVDGQTDKILDEELKRMIREAKEKAPESFGHLPGEMKEQILKFLQSKVNWKAKFRSWLQHATEVLRVSTRKRRSRRFGITYPGQKSDFKLNLGVYVDSSGSISDEDLKLFGGEINRIFDTKLANVDIMVGDTRTHEHYPMKRKMEPKDFKVSGRGGTDAAAWLRYAEKQKFDALVILTDGWFDYNLKKPSFPVLWALTVHGYKEEDFQKYVKFGKVVKLELEE